MSTATVRARRFFLREEEPEWLVWAVVILLLAVGFAVRTAVINRSAEFSEGNLTIRYPADWAPLGAADDVLLDVGESFDAGLFPPRLTVRRTPAAEVSSSARTLGDVALVWADRRAKDLLGYKVLSMEPMALRGQDAVRVDYAYVAEPVMATPNSIPVVAHGADVLLRQGDDLLVVTLLSDAGAFDGVQGTWDRILSSLDLGQEVAP